MCRGFFLNGQKRAVKFAPPFLVPSTHCKRWAGKSETLLLLTDAQLCDNRTVTLDVLFMQVVEHLTTLTNHLQKATTAVVVVLMNLQMLGQLDNASAQNRDLHLGGTGVGLVGAVRLDNGCFFFLADHGFVHLSFRSPN